MRKNAKTVCADSGTVYVADVADCLRRRYRWQRFRRGESSSGGETITWRLQSSYSLNSLQGDMATNLKEALETATNGRLQVELYEPGALCQTSDILTYLSQNAFDCAVIFGSTFSGLIPEADPACGIPFAWESSAEIYDVMENYGLLDVIQEAYGELNLKYYWNAHEPNYNVLANFQVESLEDFHGKRSALWACGATSWLRWGPLPPTSPAQRSIRPCSWAPLTALCMAGPL